MASAQRPLPEPDDTTRFYWQHARRHQLAILCCNHCSSFVHPPRSLCRGCLSDDLMPRIVSGRGRVYSYTLTHYVYHPAFAERVVAAPDTHFQLPEVAMGLVPGAGGTASLPRRIGRQHTVWLGLSGVAIDAPTALEWGLIDAIESGAIEPDAIA